MVERLVEPMHVGVDLGVPQDLLVHQALDLVDLGLVHGGVVREVEAQAPRVHHAARLLDVRAQHLRSAACSRWVAVWLRMVARRGGRSTSARNMSPTRSGASATMR